MSIAEKLETIAQNEQLVYEAGKTKQSLNVFESIQLNGTKTDYSYTFARGWNDDVFSPIYDIRMSPNVFLNTRINNLKQCMKKNNARLIVPSSGNPLYQAFMNSSYLSHIPALYGKNTLANTFVQAFQGCYNLHTIDGIEFTETNIYTSTFYGCSSLQNITISGVIGNTISFAQSQNLSIESMKNVISILKNYAGTEKSHTTTITFHNSAWKQLEADSLSPTGTTWKEYIYNDLGWNYS